MITGSMFIDFYLRFELRSLENLWFHYIVNHYIQILIILPATCLEEEGLEVVGHMGDDDEEDGWDVHCKDCPEEASAKIQN